MSARLRALRFVAVGALTLAGVMGCVAGGSYDADVGVGVGYYPGYYEPWGYDYGGWDGGYLVGPPRGGYHDGGRGGFRDGRGGGVHGGRSGGFHGGGRPAPSIPTGPRGGGRGGGGHAGGGAGHH